VPCGKAPCAREHCPEIQQNQAMADHPDTNRLACMKSSEGVKRTFMLTRVLRRAATAAAASPGAAPLT
jgi:hypothetical protein